MSYTVRFMLDVEITEANDVDDALEKAYEEARENADFYIDQLEPFGVTKDHEKERKKPVFLDKECWVAGMKFDGGTCFIPEYGTSDIWLYARPGGGHGWVRLEDDEIPGQADR